MKADIYEHMYKCRPCGRKFSMYATYGENEAATDMISFFTEANNEPETPFYTITTPTLYTMHKCKGGSMGVADFIGLRKKEDYDET